MNLVNSQQKLKDKDNEIIFHPEDPTKLNLTPKKDESKGKELNTKNYLKNGWKKLIYDVQFVVVDKSLFIPKMSRSDLLIS